MMSIGVLGFVVWSHHMYSVGLDVDTFKVSWIMATLFTIIGLYAGKLFKPRGSIEEIFKEKNSMVKLIYNSKILKSFKMREDKIKELSAGNFGLMSNEKNKETKQFFTSIRLDIIDKDLRISDHLDKHRKPNKEEFAYYLAGLIEGNGNFGDKLVEITFHLKDITTAFYIKKVIGYGSIVVLKEENTVKYRLRHNEGIKTIINLVNGKFLACSKINQLKQYKYDKIYSIEILPKVKLNLKSNYWLAGFADALASFKIKDSWAGEELSFLLVFSINSKDMQLLSLIKEIFGGNITLSKGIYEYTSSSFIEAKQYIEYFDHYHLLNHTVHIKYIQWRKIYRILQRSDHIIESNLSRIKKYQKNLRD